MATGAVGRGGAGPARMVRHRSASSAHETGGPSVAMPAGNAIEAPTGACDGDARTSEPDWTDWIGGNGTEGPGAAQAAGGPRRGIHAAGSTPRETRAVSTITATGSTATITDGATAVSAYRAIASSDAQVPHS